ncbi:hypothetical protein GCM10010484_36640 [Actinokineospora globicatena]
MGAGHSLFARARPFGGAGACSGVRGVLAGQGGVWAGNRDCGSEWAIGPESVDQFDPANSTNSHFRHDLPQPAVQPTASAQADSAAKLGLSWRAGQSIASARLGLS